MLFLTEHAESGINDNHYTYASKCWSGDHFKSRSWRLNHSRTHVNWWVVWSRSWNKNSECWRQE
jgi:hypothetical protein